MILHNTTASTIAKRLVANSSLTPRQSAAIIKIMTHAGTNVKRTTDDEGGEYEGIELSFNSLTEYDIYKLLEV